MQGEHCLHFSSFKSTKTLFIPSLPECKICSLGKNNLWLCLTRDCQEFYCGRRDWQHLFAHYQESRRKKSYHCLFINVLTAEIYCVSCKSFVNDQPNQKQQIVIKDKNERAEQSNSRQNSAFKLRSKVLPFLSELGKFEFEGQVEYPEAHRKINSGSVGIVSDRYNHSIHSAIQFIAHCSYFKQIILAISPPTHNELIIEMQNVIWQINNAKYRVITAEKLDILVYLHKPQLLTYKRKDPFELVLFFIGKIHQYLRYRALVEHYDEQDQWDVYYEKGRTKFSCPIYDSIEIQLRLNYYCAKCKKQQYSLQNINYLKLNLSKKKRNINEVEKELTEFRGHSARKDRKRSLSNLFFKESEMSITVHEMIIDLMKKPLHKDKLCDVCHQSMKKQKIQIEKLPDYLLIQINRMDSEGYAVDQTQIDFIHDVIDMGAFTLNKERQVMYTFQCAVGVEKGGFYPVMARNAHNKQLQLFRNHMIEHSQNINPYILCYKREKNEQSIGKSVAINETLSGINSQTFLIPDFWMIQQRHGFNRHFINPFVCKHNCLKPNITSLQNNKKTVTKKVYQRCVGQNSAKIYDNYTCFECEDNIKRVEQRRKEEKEAIKQYDSIKMSQYCMVSIDWINKWSNFLYRRDRPNYLGKGWPLPGKIDNKTIMEGKKCKPYLVQNKDFKLVNLYVWKFLRELYGGGPEIRYKWKKQDGLHLNERLMQQIKQRAAVMRKMLRQFTLQSPSKKSSTMQESSYLAQQQLSNIQH